MDVQKPDIEPVLQPRNVSTDAVVRRRALVLVSLRRNHKMKVVEIK
jgi:hypothetical protein